MEKNTLEKIENDYKEAIRNKFRIEKVEGKYSHYLNNPSQALLRDLCWEIFSSNPKTDDLTIYRNFFRTEFTSEEDTSTKYTDKFRKVGWFYKGEKKPANITTVELAAILVDFQPRPFANYRLKEMKKEVVAEYPINNFSNVMEEAVSESLPESEIADEDVKTEPELEQESGSKSNNDPIADKPKPYKLRYIAIASVIIGLALIIYLALPNKQCMQWSKDHYELVDCDLKVNSLGLTVPVELLDESLINLKKVEVCDTTPCFDKNGDAIIWYAKTANGVDFFNGHGRHPENNRSLKPVTKYILEKYLKK
ncbi:hypothetical protein [Flavobacterium sp. ACN6]|uniref:hypothetical protein n=1 Tax=Flavobacterium sp. ACN6 TaxID=1920426 RepID=UPI000BB3B8E7|nr:hypothetical protein [Flavobacterium sp. ACN6]PBJ14404.1 hypothetical protein BSF42_08220 [Flavobacterium sp. ACN6]